MGEDIVVAADHNALKNRAQKKSMQSVVISGEELANATARTTQDTLNLIPNVNMAHSYDFLNSFIVVRGLQEVNNSTSPLQIVVDGVPQNNQKEAFLDMVDVSSVEVMSGPQGALFGNGALGGATVITTKPPTNAYHGFVQGSYGNGAYYQGLAGLSGAMVKDKVFFRLSGGSDGFGGLIRNTYLDRNVDHINHNDSVQGRIIALPTDWLSMDFRVHYNWFKAGAEQDSIVTGTNDFARPSSDLEGASWGHVANATVKLDAQLGFATLTTITGLTDLADANRGDLDFSNLKQNPLGLGGLGAVGQGQDLAYRGISQEVRLTSRQDRPFRWVTGFYYNHQDRALQTKGFFDLNHTRDQYNDPSLVIIDHNEFDKDYAWAAYGQMEYDITKHLTLTAGTRYDSINRNQTDLSDGSQRSKTYSRPQPRVTLTWHFTPNHLLYATYSEGFRPGGFNAPGVPVAPFKAEHLDNYELGFKTAWLDNRLTLNGAFYYEKDRNFQFFYVDVATASQIIGNIDKADIYGGEVQLQALLARGLTFSAGLGTTHSQVVKSSSYAGVIGNYTPRTIPWKLNVALQYERRLWRDLNGFVRGDFEHRGHEYWQVDNLNVQSQINLVNARLGLKWGNYSVYVWGKNLTNEQYFEDYNPKAFSGAAYDLGWLAEPRTYGVEARASF
ncbi:TonB-dependent receptor [Gluconacetobacter sp. Hr-1-5]|uniref:TonB-dependent receptor n=1 Tax=Gluconacetobacter sp. Hr-1-5 TaxID=3395370 RepID=UPI003B51F302